MLLSSAFTAEGRFSPGGLVGGVFITAFFIVHYGGFMTGHLIFLCVFFVMAAGGGDGGPLAELLSVLVYTPSGEAYDGFMSAFADSIFRFESLIDFFDSESFAFSALLISNAVTFFLYFIGKGGYITSKTLDFFMRPYKRIVVMHITIIAGGFILMLIDGRNIWFVAVWLILKILADLRGQRDMFAADQNLKK
jgi:hypothetical protein